MKINENIRAYIEYEQWSMRTKLIIVIKRGSGTDIVCNDGTIVSVQGYEKLPDNAGIILPQGSLKAISDAIAEKGILPSKHKDYTDVMESTKYHLEDMRKLVFKK